MIVELQRLIPFFHSDCAPKNPMVFCHGLLGFDSVQIGPSIAPMSVSHWRGIREVLEARGIEVLVTRVRATSSPIERAKVLEARVSEVYPGRSVHLIGVCSTTFIVPYTQLYILRSQHGNALSMFLVQWGWR